VRESSSSTSVINPAMPKAEISAVSAPERAPTLYAHRLWEVVRRRECW
jgi:hypothetical protein